MTHRALTTYLADCSRGAEASRLTVVGHPAPDADAVVSSLFEAWRLTCAGIPAMPLVQAAALPREVAWLLGNAAPLVPLGAVDPAAPELVLTDPHDVAAYSGRVVAVVDHHPLSPGIDLTDIDAEIQPLGAATTLVARRIRRDGLVPDAFCARVLLGAILLDTEGLSPYKAKSQDREMAGWLAALCGEDPAALFDALQNELLSETDVLTLFTRDYRRYTDPEGAPLLGFAILKVRADAPPDRDAVRDLLRADLAAGGYRVCVAKTVLHRPDGTREEVYLAAGAGADVFLNEVLAVGGPDARRTAPDEVFLPATCAHRGRKWYAARLPEIFSKKAEK